MNKKKNLCDCSDCLKERYLSEEIDVNIDGQKIRMTKKDFLARSVINRAVKGGRKDIELLIKMGLYDK
jgi:hypothetical protein